MEDLVRKIISNPETKELYGCIYENADGTYKFYDHYYGFKRFETLKEAVQYFLGDNFNAPKERPYVKIGGFRQMKSYNKSDMYWFKSDCGLNAREAFFVFEEAGLV